MSSAAAVINPGPKSRRIAGDGLQLTCADIARYRGSLNLARSDKRKRGRFCALRLVNSSDAIGQRGAAGLAMKKCPRSSLRCGRFSGDDRR